MKAKAKQELIETLEKHKGDIRRELNRNKYLMKQLVDKQTIQKRKIVELDSIINGLNK